MHTHTFKDSMPLRLARALGAALLLFTATGCDETLSLAPTTEVEEGQAIIDAPSARAALAGAYDALQEASYYGGDFLFFTELPADDVEHSGTFTAFADLDQQVTTADNETIEDIWDDIYTGIGRANTLIAKIPGVTQLSEEERDDIIGQAYLLRALHYHNLVKLWGPVPIRTAPAQNLDELADTERASADAVYQQILADITQAQSLMSDETRTRAASQLGAEALKSRVHLYRQSWQSVITAANNVLAAGVTLAPTFNSLFSASGNDTPEDIWRVSFTATEYNLSGYYYLAKAEGGRWEIAPSDDLEQAFEANDARLAWSLSRDSRDRLYGSKWQTTEGAEDLHIIRLAEVLLNKAEAQARLGDLAGAVQTYNLVRARAGVASHVLGRDVRTQGEVLAAVLEERRKELAFEGDRWPDLVRTGRAAGLLGIPTFRTLFPIPQNEIDVAPKMVQNQGY